MFIVQHTVLNTVLGNKFISLFSNEPAILGRLFIQESARVSCGQRDLNSFRINLLRVLDGFFNDVTRFAG